MGDCAAFAIGPTELMSGFCSPRRNRLMAVDANTGKLIESFGDTGKVDLSQDLGRDPRSVSVNVNSPGVIYKDLIILGSTGATPGHIRAYDVRTGKLRWIFHTIPHPGEFVMTRGPRMHGRLRMVPTHGPV